MVTQPMQGGSASASATLDEDYIRQLQEAITSGQLYAEPLDDGSWRISPPKNGYSEPMQGGEAYAVASPETTISPPPPVEAMKPYTPPPERQINYEDGSSFKYKPTDYAISPDNPLMPGRNMPDSVVGAQPKRDQLERMNDRIISKDSNKETLRQLGLDESLADLTPYAAGRGGTVDSFFQSGYVGKGTDYASIPVYGPEYGDTKNLNKQIAFHEGVIHPIESLLTPEEQSVIYNLRAQNPDPFFMQLGEPDPRKSTDDDHYHILTGYFDAPLGAGSVDVNSAVLDYIKQLTPELKERAKAMRSGGEHTHIDPPVAELRSTAGEPQGSPEAIAKVRYEITGESDPQIQQFLFDAISEDIPWEDRQRLFQVYKEGITPTGVSTDPGGVIQKQREAAVRAEVDRRMRDGRVMRGGITAFRESVLQEVNNDTSFMSTLPSAPHVVSGLGLDREAAWDRTVKFAKEELGGNATHAAWEAWADKAATNILDPVTSAGKAILGEEEWNSLPKEVRVAASWAPILLAPETGIFKKIPIVGSLLGGIGIEGGTVALAGALGGYEVSKYTGLPEFPSELAGSVISGGIYGVVRNAVLKGAVEAEADAGMAAFKNKTREEAITDMKKVMPGLEDADYDRLYNETAEFKITPGEASRLNATYEGVRDAGPDDLVTVFAAMPGQDAARMGDEGLAPGSALSSDPETAKIHALSNGVQDPAIVAFQVPRKSLGTKDWFFTAKSKLTPVANEVLDGWIPNAQSVVKNFLKDETGSLRWGGVDDTIPDDVAKVAFGEADDGYQGMSVDVDRRLEQDEMHRGSFDDDDIRQFYGDARREAAALQDILDNPNITIGELSDLIQRAGLPKDAADELEADIVSSGAGAMGPGDRMVFGRAAQDIVLRERLFVALARVQEMGVELASRTGGKEGTVPHIDRAIKQHRTELEGGIYYHAGIPITPAQIDQFFSGLFNGVKNTLSPSSANQKVTIQPAIHTTALLGNIEIIPRRTRTDNVLDVLKMGVNGLSSKDPFFLKHNPLGDALTKAYTAAIKGPIESRANMAAAWSQYLVRPKVWGRIDKDTHRLLDIPGAPTVADLSAKLPNYWPMLSPEQQYAMSTLRDIMEPYYKALVEQGLDISDRKDIIPGGFYMPRGTAHTPGALIDEGPVVWASGRNVKKSFEKTAEFDSMVDAIEMPADAATFELVHGKAPTSDELIKFQKDWKGFRYLDFGSVMEKFFRDAGVRVLDSHIANVLLHATDDAGVPLWSTPESRLLRDPKNTQIKAQVDLLRKQVTSLTTSIDKLDYRVHRALLNFTHSPAPDLEDLRSAIDTMSTKGGTLSVRKLTNAFSTPASRKAAVDDLRQKFKDLRREVYSEVFTNRGFYAGVNPATGKKWTMEQARKDAFKQKLASLHIGNGTFKGVTFDQGKQLIDTLKTSLQSAEERWKQARDLARQNSPGQAPIQQTRFGGYGELQNHAFDQALASTVNKYLKNIDAPPNIVIESVRAVNDLIRGLRSTWDISYTGVQGLLGLSNQKDAYRHAWSGAIRSMIDPIDGRYVLGKYIDDFNKRAISKGLPSASEWMSNTLRMGGIDTEFMLGGHRGIGSVIGNLPGIRQSNRAFGYFGDILRLDGAQKQFEIKGGLNATPAERGRLMREIAYSQNLMTGWSPGRTLGSVGDLLTFAPRFLQSQIETIAKAANLTNWSVSNNAARSQLLNLMGQGVLLTMAANVLSDDEARDALAKGNVREAYRAAKDNTFDWWSPKDSQGHFNPNFMRIRTNLPVIGQKDISLFGPWDSLLRATVYAAQGDVLYLPRTKASPLVATAWDLISGRTFMGREVPKVQALATDVEKELSSWVKGTEHDFNGKGEWNVLGDYAIRSLLPFSLSTPIADAVAGEKTVKEAAVDIAIGSTGAKASDLSQSEKRNQLIAKVTAEAIEDGSIRKALEDGKTNPAILDDMARTMTDTLKSTDYFNLSSAEKKFIDREIAKRYPDMDAAWHQARRDNGNIYQIVSDEAGSIRSRWKPTFDSQLQMLMAGGDPAAIWEAYDDQRNQMAGAFKELYDGGLKESKGYQDAVSTLRPNDIRAVEAAWNAIVSDNENGKSGTFDWEKIDQKRGEFIQDLIMSDPVLADRFVATLALNDKFNLEDSHPMTVLKKIASTSLKPYYAIVDADAGKQADKRQEWLSQNPEADFNRFITADYDAGVNSVAAAGLAVQTVPNRKVNITGTNLDITPQNLPTLQKYDKQVMQLINMPRQAVVNGRNTQPVTELRKNDVLYDALYFWLGYDKSDPVVYHLSAVNSYLQQWGPRSDGVKPRQAQ